MASVRDVLSVLNHIAPSEFAFPGDKVGLQVGDVIAEVKRAVVSLDHSAGAVKACLKSHAELLLCHHPLVMKPLNDVNFGDPTKDRVGELIVAGIAYIAAHTNWDCAPGGVNDALVAELGLVDATSFGTAAECPAFKVVVFCPPDSVDSICDVAAAAGAGEIGNYNRCAFRLVGEATFDANEHSNPTTGKKGERTVLPEVRLEMEVPAGRRIAVEAAVRAAHPYEEPAIQMIQISKRGNPICRKARLRVPMGLGNFRNMLDSALGFRTTMWEGSAKVINWVGVCGGAASDEWENALAAGCDAFVTGEVKQHLALDATEKGLAMCAAGHYATEQPGVIALAAAMQKHLPDVDWQVFTPEPGANGRPA